MLCVAGHLPGIHQEQQILMPFISQQDGYIISPYMDSLSFFFDKNWRQPMTDIVSVIIKLADNETGSVQKKKIVKTMTANDHARMNAAVQRCRGIPEQLGVPADKQFLGLLNAGHPGGTLPLTVEQKDTLYDPRLPDNVYVADASILPKRWAILPFLQSWHWPKRLRPC